jgi:hypothetical protein
VTARVAEVVVLVTLTVPTEVGVAVTEGTRVVVWGVLAGGGATGEEVSVTGQTVVPMVMTSVVVTVL